MHVEVSVALNFVISYLYNKLPRRRVDCLGEELERFLKAKFAGHWYPDQPFKGSAFRCIRVTGEQMDPMMEMASSASGLDIEEVKEYLPKELTLWIDPREVSYRIGEKGEVKLLHSEKKEIEEPDSEVIGFNPEAQSFQPIESGSSNWLSSSGSTSPSQLFNRSNAATFTAASFAQTKFGSTKLKSQAKRPSRLSPTELGVYLKQRPWLTTLCPQDLADLSPQQECPHEMTAFKQDLLSPQREIAALSPQREMAALSPQREIAALSPQREMAALSPQIEMAALSPQREMAALSPQREMAALSPQRELLALSSQRELTSLSPQREFAALSPQRDLAALSPQKEFINLSPQRELSALSPLREAALNPQRENEMLGPNDLVSCFGEWNSSDLDWTCLVNSNLQHLLVAN